MAAELGVLVMFLTKAMEFSMAMQAAQAEGRDLTSAEIEEFRNSLMASDAALEEAIARARAEGR